ncbi:MAG: pitrilysin family protein [Candidatus Omnitrophota bacterium]
MFFCSVAYAAGAGYVPGYEKKVLENGATVVSNYMEGSPLVIIQVNVLSGLSNEGEYAGSGISHFLEHLLFKGTVTRTGEDIRNDVKSWGGVFNGSTGLDSAEYHITVPNENFEKALGLIVDIVMSPVFSDEDVDREKQIVLKEVRLNNDDPGRKMMKLLFSQAYRENAYKYPVIGYEDLLEGLSREDVIRYHDRVYTPDRMVIGIAGGIPSGDALKAAKEKLKGYKRGRPWDVNVRPEPRQVDGSEACFYEDVTLGYFAIGFHTTDLYSRDLYAGDVLSILLGAGDDSRLSKRLVKDKQLLYTVSCGNYTPKYPGLLVITGIGEPGNLEAARREIFNVIKDVKNDIEDREMERARNIVISEYLHSHEQIDNVVSQMTSSQLLTGDPGFFNKYVSEVKRVDADAVKKAVSKYLVEENSTTVFILPRSLERKAAPGKEMDAGAVSRDMGEKIVTLKNGLRIIAKRKGMLPLVSVTYAVPGGLRAESAGDNGISGITASLILKGTRKRKEKDLIPEIEKMGGSIGPFSGMNSVGLSMDVLKDNLDEAFDIFEDVLKNPEFPASEVSRQKKKAVASIKEQKKDIFDEGIFHLRRLLYRDHPYSRRSSGEIDTVNSFSRDDIMGFYRGRFGPAEGVISVVGDIDTESVIDDLTKRFSGWKSADKPIRDKDVIPLDISVVRDIDMEKEQALVLLGFQGVKIQDKRTYALALISSILSGTDGILFKLMREEEGLTYTSGALNVPAVDKGYFLLYAATSEENTGKVRDALFSAVSRARDGNMTDAEIESSKKRLIAEQAYSIETNRSMSMMMALDELYGLGFTDYRKYPEEINAVTKDDIVKCAREIFDPDKSAVVIIHSGR